MYKKACMMQQIKLSGSQRRQYTWHDQDGISSLTLNFQNGLEIMTFCHTTTDPLCHHSGLALKAFLKFTQKLEIYGLTWLALLPLFVSCFTCFCDPFQHHIHFQMAGKKSLYLGPFLLVQSCALDFHGSSTLFIVILSKFPKYLVGEFFFYVLDLINLPSALNVSDIVYCGNWGSQ